MPFVGHTGRVSSPSVQISNAEHINSLLFAVLFSPLAVTLMNASFVSVLGATAVGQPLSSSVGIIGTIIAGIIIAMIAVNSEYSQLGIAALSLWAFIIGIADTTAVSPTAWLIGLDAEELRHAMSWSLFPVGMTAIFSSITLAMWWIRRDAVASPNMPARIMASLVQSERHIRERSVASIVSMTCIALAGVLYVVAAPRDSLYVASLGLAGMSLTHIPHEISCILAACLLGFVGLMTRWSTIGPMFGVIVMLIFPTYIFLPMWASLTGEVVTPGTSVLTAIQMTSPVLMAFGTCFIGAMVGPLMVRHRLRTNLVTDAYEEDPHPSPQM